MADDIPAGWYEYEEGEERYWDGEQWTEESRPLASEGPQPVGASGPQPDSGGPTPVIDGGSERHIYKVLTQKDRFFGGKFDPERLEAALNAYAAEGWKVAGIATADIATWGTSRQELVVVMSRTE
ncbi:MAG TPA: DUF4177 domain-containing protein [Solirubrobacterales bacterium]|nr:DUF4177 domain-containing protein [Solirubrobacterales bacterium]